MTSAEHSVILINSFITDSSDKNMYDLINYAREHDLDDYAIILLARGLAHSGLIIRNTAGQNLFDIPSTGGPSSLSTLICPVLLALLGNAVLKLGVPGRPAGGIDVLSQINGYNINPSTEEISQWLKESLYVHFLANDKFTPLDAKFFQFRKANSGISIPALVIASLLSKKITVELNHVGLDVRVSKFGNFGTSMDQAKKNSLRFNKIARMVGIESKCFLTNGIFPQQPYIGRGEALLALDKIFEVKDDGYLRGHLSICTKMVLAISKRADFNFTTDDIKIKFFENVKLQGGSEDSFYKIVTEVEKLHVNTITSSQSGFLSIDIYKIRDSIVSIQNLTKNSVFSDPCGIILKRMANEYISKDEIICSFRCRNEFKEIFRKALENSFSILNDSVISTDVEIVN